MHAGLDKTAWRFCNKPGNASSHRQQGIRCTAGYVTAPQCSPTRADLLTGRYQQRFGHDNNNYNLACFHTGQRLFPEHLKAAGYVRRHPNRPWFLYTAFNAPRCSQNGMR